MAALKKQGTHIGVPLHCRIEKEHYYAIVEPEGIYAINQVPPGKYNLIAWHPVLGTQEKKIEVGSTGQVTANFEFSLPTGRDD